MLEDEALPDDECGTVLMKECTPLLQKSTLLAAGGKRVKSDRWDSHELLRDGVRCERDLRQLQAQRFPGGGRSSL